MARPKHTLTSAELKTKAPGKYSDGGGLWFHSRLDGGAQWFLRYTIFGRRHEMGLGSFPDVTPKATREEADTWAPMTLSFLARSWRSLEIPLPSEERHRKHLCNSW